MAMIKIDGQDVDTDTLSDETKTHLAMLQMIDNELRHLQLQVDIAQTARGVRVQLIKAGLASPLAGDTIKLG